MSLKVFIDTEFTDFIDTHLISIGMAADSGEEFYAEVPYPDASCSAFVREAVIPRLGRVAGSKCQFDELSGKIINWLTRIRPKNQVIHICYDYQMDWELLIDALDYRLPTWCQGKLVAYNINEELRQEFHSKNDLPEHHALYDALANRYAFKA